MTRVGDDLVEAFGEMAAFMRGEVQAESYEVPDDGLTAERIGKICRSVAQRNRLIARQHQIVRNRVPHSGAHN